MVELVARYDISKGFSTGRREDEKLPVLSNHTDLACFFFPVELLTEQTLSHVVRRFLMNRTRRWSAKLTSSGISPV